MWDAFQSIQCIHMPHRKDRYESCVKECKKYNMPLQFFHVEKHPLSGKQGCFESHIRVMKHNMHYDNCLIFEDDFTFTCHFNEQTLKEVIHFMKHTNWDIIFLGCFPDVMYPAQNIIGNIYYVKATCTQSYVVSKKFMTKMANETYSGIAIDEFYKNFNTFAILPGLFRQSRSSTDVSSIKFISPMIFKNNVWAFTEYYAINSNDLWACVVVLFALLRLVTKNKNGWFKNR